MSPSDTLVLSSLIASIREEIQLVFSTELPVYDDFYVAQHQTVQSQYIDHTLLKPTATETEIETIATEAREHEFAAVCVNPRWVSTAARFLKGTSVKVCTVVGFPLGAACTETKVFETRKALDDGATEIDMVLSIGDIKAKNWKYIYKDIQSVVQETGDRGIVKVILETCLLTTEEIIAACLLSTLAGAKFVKTSTGFGGAGASVESVALMRTCVGPSLGVKASGGIRTSSQALQLLNAGASRLGASCGPDLLG